MLISESLHFRTCTQSEEIRPTIFYNVGYWEIIIWFDESRKGYDSSRVGFECSDSFNIKSIDRCYPDDIESKYDSKQFSFVCESK